MTVEVHGFCEERFLPLREAFAANFADGNEVGASFAATLQGEPVVDLWAGHADFARTRPWERDTTVLLMSTMKIPLILSFLMLVDRGQIALDATVATYWPEFAAGGKDRVTVREAMTHRAGVPGFEPPVTGDR
jgi:CubicO group peptidase (beta-lactamase class C family)